MAAAASSGMRAETTRRAVAGAAGSAGRGGQRAPAVAGAAGSAGRGAASQVLGLRQPNATVLMARRSAGQKEESGSQEGAAQNGWGSGIRQSCQPASPRQPHSQISDGWPRRSHANRGAWRRLAVYITLIYFLCQLVTSAFASSW